LWAALSDGGLETHQPLRSVASADQVDVRSIGAFCKGRLCMAVAE
jgi:hypothetical protein